MGKYVFVKLKWGWELKGILQARDAYMNLLLLHA
jgi:small nuclear ribonucleoprotein (snRNP)-like protein